MSLVQDPSSGTAANVKPPSTAAVAADQALVVAISPNNPVSATATGSKSDNGGVPGATNLGVLPAVANAAAPTKTEGNQVSLSTDLAGSVRVTAAALPLPTGAATAANQTTLGNQTTQINDGTNTAAVKAASVAAVATDPALVVDSRHPATGALANVAGSAASVTLLAANVARLGATIFNDSTAILYVKFGTTASLTSFTVRMISNAYYEVPFRYTGRIDGIWASATGNARVTELS